MQTGLNGVIGFPKTAKRRKRYGWSTTKSTLENSVYPMTMLLKKPSALVGLTALFSEWMRSGTGKNLLPGTGTATGQHTMQEGQTG